MISKLPMPLTTKANKRLTALLTDITHSPILQMTHFLAVRDYFTGGCGELQNSLIKMKNL